MPKKGEHDSYPQDRFFSTSVIRYLGRADLSPGPTRMCSLSELSRWSLRGPLGETRALLGLFSLRAGWDRLSVGFQV